MSPFIHENACALINARARARALAFVLNMPTNCARGELELGIVELDNPDK